MSLLADRTMSGFPLSIGTGLAFESVFNQTQPPYDPKRVIPNKIDILNYNELWINWFTLFRNLIGSIRREQFLNADPQHFAEAIINEMEIITSLLKNEGNDVCKPIFYHCNYDAVFKHQHKLVQLRKDKTEFQVLSTTKYLSAYKFFNKHYPQMVLELDSVLTPSNKVNGLLLTHIPHDLLSHVKFDKLDLLESHTGVLKPRYLWYTKYYPVPRENMSIVPFNRKLIKVFGDHVMFHPLDIRLRNLIMASARGNRWTAMTTLEKIMFDLRNDIQEVFVYETLTNI